MDETHFLCCFFLHLTLAFDTVKSIVRIQEGGGGFRQQGLRPVICRTA